ncbi:STAS domain-containing protein [Nocardioides marmoribigeumensis]|uniref:RsbT co-antagonist protein RsbR n=1 Tax=Nocardioides marmoribigeumensis TaxID=433649 RepID=A0ABU2BY28_9ACTN|nr:STAS domain-containing protein [Nocardioides marmoribigeumensis]MDR7363297.1 rsbT co-antagonist protein RsbR [Nocardioides marmoribigeumensis]
MSDSTTQGWPELLRTNRDAVVGQWTRTVERTLAGRMTSAESSRDIGEIYAALLEGASQGARTDVRGGSYDGLRSLLSDLSRARARQGFTPTETAVNVFALKDAVLDVLEDGGDAAGYRAFADLSRIVDDLGLFMLETYAATRESVISEQAESLLELSTPVVKLWKGIVALPLVGTLDSARTQVVMEALLQALVDTGSEHAIIDITGVAAVDTQVAQHLLKTVQAARLLGAECIISGIRPQIAQTVVALGIEFGDIQTKASLADALLAALRSSGLDVVGYRGES